VIFKQTEIHPKMRPKCIKFVGNIKGTFFSFGGVSA